MWQLNRKQRAIFLISLIGLGAIWFQHNHGFGGPINRAVDCSGVTDWQEHRVTVTESGFTPSEVKAKRCDRLTYTNSGQKRHQPAAGPHPSHKSYPEINVPFPLKASQQHMVVLKRAGQYEFHDHFAEDQIGKLSVIE